jgi:hypothetical protein
MARGAWVPGRTFLVNRDRAYLDNAGKDGWPPDLLEADVVVAVGLSQVLRGSRESRLTILDVRTSRERIWSEFSEPAIVSDSWAGANFERIGSYARLRIQPHRLKMACSSWH